MSQGMARLAAAVATVLAVACGQTDPGITTAVKTKLTTDETVKAYQIDVDTTDRVVTLSGAVESAAAKEQAVLLARQTEGVRDVVDRITVGPRATATTGELSEAEREARDAGTRTGEDIREETREAGDAAQESTRDARTRAGQATDRAQGAVADAGITSAVKAKLLADTAVSGLKIDVDTDGGVVTLTGTANTRAEADRAVRLARETDGVRQVVNNVKVTR